MLLNSRQFKFLKNYRNFYVKSSTKREIRDENVFLKGMLQVDHVIKPVLRSIFLFSTYKY